MVKNMERHSPSTNPQEASYDDFALEEWERELLEQDSGDQIVETYQIPQDPLAHELDKLPPTPNDKNQRVQAFERGDRRQDHGTRGTSGDNLQKRIRKKTQHIQDPLERSWIGSVVTWDHEDTLHEQHVNRTRREKAEKARAKLALADTDPVYPNEYLELTSIDASAEVADWERVLAEENLSPIEEHDVNLYVNGYLGYEQDGELEDTDPFDRIDHPDLREEIQGALRFRGKKANEIKVQLDPELDSEMDYQLPDYVDGYYNGKIGDNRW